MRHIVFIQGGGIGYDQELAVRRLFDAAGVAIDWQVFPAGYEAQKAGLPVVSDELIKAVRAAGVALKTKLLPPPDGLPPLNYNVHFRRALGLFASVRPVHNLAGLPSRFCDVDFTLIREITEDLYTSTEHEIVPGVVQSFKIVTEAACLRFFRFAFDFAVQQGRKSVHCIHKANILKMADGLYLDCFRRVAREYPHIQTREMIVDNCCMQLVSRPQQFEVLAAGNLYGDLLSDLGAGLVGGISATASINQGEQVRVYESVYGAPLTAVGADWANPLPLIMPAIAMLQDLGESEPAARIGKAVERVLTNERVRPRDLGGTARTSEFTQALIEALP
jgi:isocitrate dehydrogenase (NAD+)